MTPTCHPPNGPAPHLLLPLGPEGVEGSEAKGLGELAPHVTEEDGAQLLQSALHHRLAQGRRPARRGDSVELLGRAEPDGGRGVVHKTVWVSQVEGPGGEGHQTGAGEHGGGREEGGRRTRGRGWPREGPQWGKEGAWCWGGREGGGRAVGEGGPGPVAAADCGTPSLETRHPRSPPPRVRRGRSQEQGGLGLARWVCREGRRPLARTVGGSAGRGRGQSASW